jgi:hypothetical protein
MAITDSKKIDFLWKKLGYGAAKTDTNTAKKAPNEATASPLLIRGDNTWVESSSIPGTLPGASSGVVTVFPTSAPKETTADGSATANRTWQTGLTDWIPPEIGSTYQVKVYIHTSSNAASAASSGDQVFATGSGNDDEWFFDYQAGVLHFIGTNLPNGISFSGKSVYISGGRYTGTKGVNQIKQIDQTDGIILPSGTTGERSTTTQGLIRFNTTTGNFEGSTDGSSFVTFTTSGSGASGTATITKEQFTGDGSSTQFTLSTAPSDENNIIVYVDGVMQEPDANYTLSGTKLSFTAGGDGSSVEAPHDGARIVVMLGFDTI